MSDDFLDDDGYPTDEALKRIVEWPYEDIPGMLDFCSESGGARRCLSTSVMRSSGCQPEVGRVMNR